MADPMNRFTYSPQIAPGNVRIVAMPADQRAITPRNFVTLQMPYDPLDAYDDGTNVEVDPIILELRNPKLGNQIANKISKIQRTSRGGVMLLTRDSTWLRTLVVNWSFEGLTYPQSEAILNFCSESLGRIIKIVDYESRVMKGIITNPTNPVTQDFPDSRCSDFFAQSYSWDLDFQGVYV